MAAKAGVQDVLKNWIPALAGGRKNFRAFQLWPGLRTDFIRKPYSFLPLAPPLPRGERGGSRMDGSLKIAA